MNTDLHQCPNLKQRPPQAGQLRGKRRAYPRKGMRPSSPLVETLERRPEASRTYTAPPRGCNTTSPVRRSPQPARPRRRPARASAKSWKRYGFLKASERPSDRFPEGIFFCRHDDDWTTGRRFRRTPDACLLKHGRVSQNFVRLGQPRRSFRDRVHRAGVKRQRGSGARQFGETKRGAAMLQLCPRQALRQQKARPFGRAQVNTR
jgi:hypothetical protein